MEKRSARKNETKKASGMKKKVATLFVAGSLVMGAGVAFGNSDLYTSLKGFLDKMLGNEKTALTAEAAETEGAAMTDLESFVTSMIDKITGNLDTHNDAKKTEVTSAINTHNSTLQNGVETQINDDLDTAKGQLDALAEQEIDSATSKLDAKYQELITNASLPAAEGTVGQ